MPSPVNPGANAWTALVLTGGSSSRMGRDKASISVGGVTMLDRILRGLPTTVPVIVCGPEPGDPLRPVTVCRENPPGGGPVAGIGAGLLAVRTPIVGVCAVDMPFGAGLVAQLASAMAAMPESDRPDALVPSDPAGVRQPLCAAYATTALRKAVGPEADAAGTSMRQILARLDEVQQYGVSHDDLRVRDADTPEDLSTLRRATALASGQGILTTTPRRRGLTMREWVDALKQELGIDFDIDIDLVLDVAKDAAHGVERPAAPVTTFLVGYAVAAGADPTEVAGKVQRLAENWASRG